jgi:hypothetical protein
MAFRDSTLHLTGQQCLQTFVDYSLNAEAVSNYLASEVPPELLKSGRKSVRESGAPSVHKRNRKETTTTPPPSSSSDLRALEIPEKIGGELKEALLGLVDGLDLATAQAVIDEAIGIHAAGGVRVSPSRQ